jgi:hypothetical protein
LLIKRGNGFPSCFTSVALFERTAPDSDPAIFTRDSTVPVLGPLALKMQHSRCTPPASVRNMLSIRAIFVRPVEVIVFARSECSPLCCVLQTVNGRPLSLLQHRTIWKSVIALYLFNWHAAFKPKYIPHPAHSVEGGTQQSQEGNNLHGTPLSTHFPVYGSAAQHTRRQSYRS